MNRANPGVRCFWPALREIYPATREQRCWVHKTANVLNKLPKPVQAKAKPMLQEIWMAETCKEADDAFDLFVSSFAAKYPKAVDCLVKDRNVLLSFYDFPAEHWVHLRTTNPIESTFCDGPLANRSDQGLRQSYGVPDNGVQIGSVCRETLASAQRRRVAA